MADEGLLHSGGMASPEEGLLAEARALAARGDFRRALSCYREHCDAEPYNPELWLELAEVAERAGFVGEAVVTLFHVADLFARAGMAEAAEIAERVLRLDAGHAGARQILDMFSARWAGAPLADAHDSTDHLEGVVVPAGDAVPAAATGVEPISVADLYPEDMAIPVPQGDLPSGPVVMVRSGRAGAGPAPLDGAAARAGELRGRDERRLIESLLEASSSQLVDALAPDALGALIEAAAVQRCRRGDIIFQQGDAGTSLYLILAGAMDVERRDPSGQNRRLATLQAGAFFGEMALLAGAPRSATVRAVSDAILLKLSRNAVRELSARDSSVVDTLMRFFRARLVGTFVATSPLFKPLSAEERRALVGRFRMRELAAGTVVLAQGQRSDGLYLVLVGQLSAQVEDGGCVVELGALGPGDVFGEMSLIEGEPAMASIRAVERAWVLRLPEEDVHGMVRAHAEILQALSEISAARRARNRQIMKR